MTPWLDDGDVQLFHGDAAPVLADLPAESVQCVVTSPPYWGLRDYGVPEQIGLEATLDAYIDSLRDVFGSLWHVLRPDGVVWLNLGDAYAGGSSGDRYTGMNERLGRSPGQRKQDEGQRRRSPVTSSRRRDDTEVPRSDYGVDGLKPKDLVGIPWRVAFALQADGWYLRSAVVWDKPNPMPESVTDRPTSSYEMVFMLTKSARYYYDQEAVRERYEAVPQRRHTALHDQPKATARAEAGVAQGNPQGGAHASPYDVQAETLGDLPPDGPRGPDGRRVTTRTTGPLSHENYGELSHTDGRERWPNGGRNMRNVWRIATQPTPEAHFATYPEKLVRRCIMAATSEAGECSACGTPWRRVVERTGAVNERRREDVGDWIREKGGNADGKRSLSGATYERVSRATEDWERGCACDAPAVPQRVLDPFIGSGTTALVARRLGRHAVGIDLNESYLQIAADRTRQLSLLG